MVMDNQATMPDMEWAKNKRGLVIKKSSRHFTFANVFFRDCQESSAALLFIQKIPESKKGS